MEDAYTAVVAEDNLTVQRLLVKFLQSLDIIVLDSVSNGNRLIQACREHKPNLLLVDIGLDKVNGIDACNHILQELDEKPNVIFITASRLPEHYAAGFRLGLIDYIEKPIDYDRLKKAILSAREQYMLKKSAEVKKEEVRWLTIKRKHKHHEELINESHIVYIKKNKNEHAVIYCHDGVQIETSLPLKDIASQSTSLFAPHKGYLVNLAFIENILPTFIEGTMEIHMYHTDERIPLARRKYRECKERLNEMKA